MEPNIKNYYDLIADTENTWDYPEEDETFYIDTKFVGDEEIDYRIILGNEKIVFIKAGAGGSACGFENKYLRMAERIHENLGCTVICASNPEVPHSDIDEKEIRWLIFEMELSGFELYFIGTSDGAYHNLSLAKRFPETKKWIGINTSFIDASDLSEKLLSLGAVSKKLVYGTKDDDFDEVVPMIKEMTCDSLTLKTVEDADHRFTGMTEEFIALSDYLND